MTDINNTLQLLEKKVKYQSFSKLLKSLYHGEKPLRQCLEQKFLEYDPDHENPESLKRKIRNWLKDRNCPGNREELFKICFALKCTVSEAEKILGTTAESGIHYRNPRELIYEFCLRKGMDYPQAQQLAGELLEKSFPAKKNEYRDEIRKTGNKEIARGSTIFIKNKFREVNTEEQLKSFFKIYGENFGAFHNTAYRKFMCMLEYLKNCETVVQNMPKEQQYSVERVVKEYLRMKIPYEKRTHSYTKLQKEIKKQWPSAKVINEMYQRKTDVNRRILLLLYIATEGMGTDLEGEGNIWISRHYQKINLMMIDCGMPVLDLHRPFDYVIMQAIAGAAEEGFMSIRLERILLALFLKRGKTAFISDEEK